MVSRLRDPLPYAARPVVRILRRDVPRPKAVPKWSRWRRKRDGVWQRCCPMGLHPKATRPAPIATAGFDLAPRYAVTAFGVWWDYCTEGQPRPVVEAAMDVIWPREETA